MKNEIQILVGKEYINEKEKLNHYQLMANWILEVESAYPFIDETVSSQIEASRNLAIELNKKDAVDFRLYNGIKYDSKTKKFSEIEPLSVLEETVVKQTLKIIGGILV